MPTEIVIETRDEPGVIAAIGELFGEWRINIRAAAAFTYEGKGFLHFVVNDAERAIAALKPAGWNVVQRREVLQVSLDDQPGELGRYARRLANAGISISTLYSAGGHGGDVELIVAVENVEAAKEV
ncbi:MAG TPA: hypothetical protein VJQ08_11580 [Candidatus Dormibacteraeota bacterium]|nr:hypothetical protein [Candidatus Dormibacteraeota bacterium]